MSTIEFDGYGNCIISTKDASNNISFLMTDYVFNNSIEKLRQDIEECNDSAVKHRLIKFCELYPEYLEEGPLGIEDISDSSRTNNIEITLSDTGSWDVIVHNIAEPEHSGFWYAAHDLSRESKSISLLKHKLEAGVVFVKDYDAIIALTKTLHSEEEVASQLRARGLDEMQSEFILSFPMRRLPELENATAIISKCEQMLRLIQKIGE